MPDIQKDDTVIRLIKDALILMRNGLGWTKGNDSEDWDGNVTDTGDPNACAFCLVGSVMRAAFDMGVLNSEEPYVEDALLALTHTAKLRPQSGFPGYALGGWNDEQKRTWLDVKTLCKETITRLEK